LHMLAGFRPDFEPGVGSIDRIMFDDLTEAFDLGVVYGSVRPIVCRQNNWDN
jgi:hypothetical protein